MFLYNLIDFVNQISLLRAVMKAILEIAATFSGCLGLRSLFKQFCVSRSTTAITRKLDICDSSLIIASCGFNYSRSRWSFYGQLPRLTTSSRYLFSRLLLKADYPLISLCPIVRNIPRKFTNGYFMRVFDTSLLDHCLYTRCKFSSLFLNL